MAALVALNLHAAVGMHPLVAAQVGELGVALEADLTPEWLHRAVYVRVLFQTGAGGKGLATLRAGVTAGPYMIGPDVSLKIAGVSENLLTVLAWKASVLPMDHLMPQEVRFPGEGLGAVVTAVLVGFVAVILNHMVIQPRKGKEKGKF